MLILYYKNILQEETCSNKTREPSMMQNLHSYRTQMCSKIHLRNVLGMFTYLWKSLEYILSVRMA